LCIARALARGLARHGRQIDSVTTTDSEFPLVSAIKSDVVPKLAVFAVTVNAPLLVAGETVKMFVFSLVALKLPL
jgi:hypothetical protein